MRHGAFESNGPSERQIGSPELNPTSHPSTDESVMRLDAAVQSVGLQIHIYMAVNVSAAWLNLLEAKSAECDRFLDHEPLSSHEHFVDAVEAIAGKYKQRNIQQVLNRLGQAHNRVTDFAKAASHPFSGELHCEDLLEPVWNITFALIKVLSVILRLCPSY